MIVYFTDSHFRSTPPRRRKDKDIVSTVLNKTQFVIDLARKKKAEAILCGGDIGDTWDWRISLIRKVAGVLNTSPCPIYSVVGNHDVPGGNTEYWEDTGLGLLSQLSPLRVLRKGEYVDLPSYRVFGFGDGESETEEVLTGSMSQPLNPDKYNVAVIHASVGGTPSVYAKGVLEITLPPGLQYALFGDIHEGFGPIKNGEVVCCNPGSLLRKTKKDMKRIPKVALIDKEKIFLVNVPCSPYAEVFDVEAIAEQEEDIGKRFVAAIESARTIQDEDAKSRVRRIGAAANYSQESIETLCKEME